MAHGLPPILHHLPGLLVFVAGLAVGGFLNMFTSLESDLLGWRIAAMASFLAGGALLFVSAGLVQTSRQRAELLGDPKTPGDLLRQFRQALGAKGLLALAAGTIATLLAVALLVAATVLRHQAA